MGMEDIKVGVERLGIKNAV